MNRKYYIVLVNGVVLIILALAPAIVVTIGTDKASSDDQQCNGSEGPGTDNCQGKVDKPTERANKQMGSSKTMVDSKLAGLLETIKSLKLQSRYDDALEKLEQIERKFPNNLYVLKEKFEVLDEKSSKLRSNNVLDQALDICVRYLKSPEREVDASLLMSFGMRCAERHNFRGRSDRAATTYKQLLVHSPNNVEILNKLGVAYLMMNRNGDAKVHFEKALGIQPDNGFTQVHVGFIAKVHDKDYEKAAKYLSKGIESGAPGTIDGRFFHQLGDSLIRINQKDRAIEAYEDGARKGVFLSKTQRSLYNVARLTARPFWTIEQTENADMLRELEKNWKIIRDEGLAQIDPKTKAFTNQEEDILEKGSWKQFTLYSRGTQVRENCAKTPKTCRLLEKYPAAKTTRGQVKYSILYGNSHVWPHCGPTNCRIRAHLGLIVPDGPYIRVLNETRTWKEGEIIVIDDSIEHEVWHNGTEYRLILIVDMWHPELTATERATLSPI